MCSAWCRKRRADWHAQRLGLLAVHGDAVLRYGRLERGADAAQLLPLVGGLNQAIGDLGEVLEASRLSGPAGRVRSRPWY